MKKLLFLLLIGLIVWWGSDYRPETDDSSQEAADNRWRVTAESAYRNRLDTVWIEDEGVVDKILADDLQGARHQRFILRLPSRQTLLVAHNIDKAPRLENLQIGSTLRFRGEYVWNDKGGLVHWTHHKSAMGDAGWLEKAGRRYE
ncbi:MAG: DUF3465 domain-containing protein [Candidatus Accumulibacter sp.]|nr:DUF3465 domain-containing protein [Accumulibacter sp.]